MNFYETPATVEALTDVLTFVETQLEAAGCPMKQQLQVGVAVEELFVNIARYAYAGQPAPGMARIGVAVDTGRITVRLEDGGMPYDPLSRAEPDITLSAEDRPIGGLGILMVKKTMDAVYYRHEGGKNVMTIEKAM